MKLNRVERAGVERLGVYVTSLNGYIRISVQEVASVARFETVISSDGMGMSLELLPVGT